MLLLLISLTLFLLVGIPIAYALGLSSLVYFVVMRPSQLVVLPQVFFSGLDSYTLIALPLFVLMGQLMNASGITARLLSICLVFVGRFRGGLGLVNVCASMIFGGISGSSASDTASIGAVLIPEMSERGYPRSFATGITVASSTMGMVIPPSIPMVIYAVAAQESVGKLFLGGVLPGILIGLLQLALVYFLAKRRDYPTEETERNWAQVIRELLGSLYVLLMPLFVVGVVVTGVATATESAALGVFYALVVGWVVTGRLRWNELLKALRSTATMSAKIMMIIAMSQVFIWILAVERVPQQVAEAVVALELNPTSLLALIAVLVLIAGTFIDVSPAILVLTPVFLPAIQAAGISPVLFGVVLVSGLAVGACTPPVGNCLNVGAAVSGLRVGVIFRAAFPFLLANVVVLFLLICFPQLVLWLPSLVAND